jgi:hypothetical protein
MAWGRLASELDWEARGRDEIGPTEVIEAARVSGSVRGRIVVKIG